MSNERRNAYFVRRIVAAAGLLALVGCASGPPPPPTATGPARYVNGEYIKGEPIWSEPPAEAAVPDKDKHAIRLPAEPGEAFTGARP